MLYDNPTLHNGFVISGSSFRLGSGKWHCQVLIERSGFVSTGMEVAPPCIDDSEAAQQAISAGWRMVDSTGFCLSPAA